MKKVKQKMAFHQFLSGFVVIILVLSEGCHSQSQQPKCGVSSTNTRIVGGQNASPTDWPWQAIVQDDMHLCGGSLISKEWVLTAAHCLTDVVGNISVTLGRENWTGLNENEVRVGVEMSITHPDYDDLIFDNDIGLLKLSTPVNFTAFVFPACLAAAESVVHTGTKSWVTGWGVAENETFPDILQEVDVLVVGNNKCRCAYPELTANMICAGHKSGGKDSCQGDSGGPLVSKQDSVWVQTGVVSFGQVCGDPEFPGVYARVSRYQEWINQTTGSSEIGFVTFTSPGTDSDANFTCPRPTRPSATTAQTTPPVTDDESVFGGGESMIHSQIAAFLSLCLLLQSVYVLGGYV